MGSFHLTMRLTIFCYFWVLLVPINAKDDFMSNSTRTTTETLWEMRDHPNDILNIVYEILRGYALDCCTNPDYGFGLPEANCETKQLAFWASVDKDVWDEDDPNNANQDLDLMNWLEDNTILILPLLRRQDTYARELVMTMITTQILPKLPELPRQMWVILKPNSSHQ